MTWPNYYKPLLFPYLLALSQIVRNVSWILNPFLFVGNSLLKWPDKSNTSYAMLDFESGIENL